MHCGVVLVLRLWEIEAVGRVPAGGGRGGEVERGVGSECPPGRGGRRVDVGRCEQGV